MQKRRRPKKERIRSIRVSDKRSADSDIVGNVVVDYDKNGKVVNIDVMNFNIDDFAPRNRSTFETRARIVELVVLFVTILVLIWQTHQLITQNRLSVRPLVAPSSGPAENLVKNIGNGPALNIHLFSVNRLADDKISIIHSNDYWLALGAGQEFNFGNISNPEKVEEMSVKKFYQLVPIEKFKLSELAAAENGSNGILWYSDNANNCYVTVLWPDHSMVFEDLGRCTYSYL